MNVKIKSFLLFNTEIINVDIYGYSSRSLPGLEINGLGRRSKLIKEKINYITTGNLDIKSSMKKFVISAESSISEEKIKNISADLELPILILYWTLLGVLPFKNLDRCISIGSFSVDLNIDASTLKTIWKIPDKKRDWQQHIIIGPRSFIPEDCSHYITWEDLVMPLQLNKACPLNESGVIIPRVDKTVGATS